MGRICSMHGNDRVYKIEIAKLKMKKRLDKLNCRSQYNIKIDLK
jgi:hypothetical protein